MENKKNTIGCSAGRAKIVDPNDFDGFKSSDNVPVQLEDLNISVKLTSFRKARTLLTGEVEGGVKDNVSQISVNFIEGSNLGGKKVLTTSFTDLTTSFESDITNDETLGITNIDIEFNASMAPMITINFVDVRGSAIFQNEENILNNRGNKYTTFFQLPYPIFELEVKGFYGMPVKYCLHMLKFNSKFNSKTGNFEITANFIGYTFALMSDMLIGYLKAIPFTKIGGERFNKYNETFTNGNYVLKLSDLSMAISKLNEGIKKEVNDNPATKEINAVEESTDYIDLIKNQILQLGQNFDLNTKKEEYQFIVFNSTTEYTDSQKNAINNQYKTSVKDFIEKFNKVNSVNKLIESDFLNFESPTNTTGGKMYKDVTLEDLTSTVNNPNLILKLGSPANIIELKEKIVKHIAKYNATPEIGPKASLNIFDMSALYETLDKNKKSLEVSGNEAKKKLAKAFEAEVREIIGFDPTARNIIECYTAAIETFIETIFIVSESASKNTERTSELAKKFKNDSDSNKTTDMSNEFIKKEEFFPWPDYREKDAEKKSYVDKYLGASDVLDSPNKVDELVFIDDLLEAFRKASKLEKEAIENQEKNANTWNPVSPYDSVIFAQKEPYERAGDLTTIADVVRLMVIRAMVFLGYSNDSTILSDEEIKGMGVAEVNNMLRGVKDSVVRQALTQIKLDFIKNITGTINEKSDIKLLEKSKTGNGLYYNYIYNVNGENSFKVLPLNQKFNNSTWGDPVSANIKKDLVNERDNLENYFLTNYSDAPGFPKLDDGGLNIKILDTIPTPVTLATIPEGVPTETKMVLSELKLDVVTAKAGYNSFNPNYGVQEYKDMDWGDENLDDLPLMYVFYRNCDTGLASTKLETSKRKKLKSETTSPYSIISKPFYAPSKTSSFLSVESQSSAVMHGSLGFNREFFKFLRNGSGSLVTYPYVELKYKLEKYENEIEPRKAYDSWSFTLFGSTLYYNQSYAEIVKKDKRKVACDDYSRALLYLQTLPFNVDQKTGSPLSKNEIKHLFNMKSGIIHAPRLWCAYIGSILWRLDTSDPIIENGKIIGGGSGTKDPIVWSVNYATKNINNLNESDSYWNIPVIKQSGKKDQFFPTVLDLKSLVFSNDTPDYSTKIIDDNSFIKTLPEQAKNEFKNIFFEFVNGDRETGWKALASKLEIFETSSKNSGQNFNIFIKNIYSNIGDKINPTNLVKGKIGNNSFNVKTDNMKNYYDVITPITGYDFDFHLHLQLQDGYGTNDAVTTIIDGLMEEVIIINNNYKIWKENGSVNQRAAIIADENKFNMYFDAAIAVLSGKTDEYNISKQNENLDVAAFGTANKDIIRLQLYRNCKNIYDKWLGGAKDVDSLVFQCGGGRSSVDEALAKKYNNSKTRMIDSFRFVTRNFRDIGNELYINPIPINNMLIGNPNSSSYDGIASILAANNFNFQALPNFINFHDDENLKAIFKPYNYSQDLIKKGSCGPAFVCVYDGQASKHLALKDGNYPNDGFDLRCMNGDVDVSVPTDFTSEKYADYEDPISTFMVRYSQQNQNIFKDIELDQSEFSETDESLHIQDEISQKGSENNRAIVGQNIYNVYAVRSYTAQVEMMGNAMIQPMMYFQLDNIPMFHGAYLITKVSHSIKPNSMSTHFTGTRIRYPETPLITAYDVYMDILETLDLSSAGTGTVGNTSVPNSSPPILQTLIDNGCTSSNINSGNIKSCKVNKIPGIQFMLNSNTEMVCEAVEPLTEMMKDWVEWMKSEGFKPVGEGKSYAYITSMFRTKGDSNSMHNFGLALDFQFFSKDFVNPLTNTKQFKNAEENITNVKNAFNFEKNPALKWLYNHAYEYGFVQPYWANDGNNVGGANGEEWWHWEYHGKSAIYQLRKRPIPATGGNKASDNPLSEIKESKIKSFVHNPKDKDNKEAVYTNMDYKTTVSSDKANGIYPSVDDYPKGPVKVKDQPIPNLNAGTLQFYDKLLDKLGAPKTDGNKFILMAWSQIENPSCNWNAFSTKQPYGNSVSCISSGVNKNVQKFTNIDEGVGAAHKTLTNGNYPNLVAALKSGIKTKQDAYNVAVTLQQSPKGDFCVWKEGGIGCKKTNGVPATTYIAQILGTGKMSGKNIAGSS